MGFSRKWPRGRGRKSLVTKSQLARAVRSHQQEGWVTLLDTAKCTVSDITTSQCSFNVAIALVGTAVVQSAMEVDIRRVVGSVLFDVSQSAPTAESVRLRFGVRREHVDSGGTNVADVWTAGDLQRGEWQSLYETTYVVQQTAGQMPGGCCSNVSGELAEGTGVISTECTPCGDDTSWWPNRVPGLPVRWNAGTNIRKCKLKADEQLMLYIGGATLSGQPIGQVRFWGLVRAWVARG